jgi:hypothetical protein
MLLFSQGALARAFRKCRLLNDRIVLLKKEALQVDDATGSILR